VRVIAAAISTLIGD